MGVTVYDVDFTRLPANALAAWQPMAPAEVSDCLGRGWSMQGAIAPLDPAMTLVGQARTVSAMAADNSALHVALEVAKPGEILVVNAQAFADVAIWGGLMTRAAIEKGIAGIVVDGAVRDSAEIVQLGFPTFARNAVPRGPHKGFGGEVGCPIACAGVPVSSGDLILGDRDGITVVPLARVEETLQAAQALQAKEAETIKTIESGGSLAAIYGVPEYKVIKSE